VKLLESLGVIDVGLVAGHVLHVAGIDDEHVETSRLQNLA
jgi:hypothetical protein